jgi:hypothetical protein
LLCRCLSFCDHRSDDNGMAVLIRN